MTLKLRVITMLSALCFLGSTACFAAAAADALYSPSGDEEQPVAEEPVYTDPTPTPAPEPEPTYEPEPVVSYEPEPTVSYEPEPNVPEDPGYTESVPEVQPAESVPEYNPAEPTDSEPIYSGTYSDLIGENNFPQPLESTVSAAPDYGTTTSFYVDNTEQYNQYIYNTNQQQFDDDYIYIPQYEAPAESLVNTSSKVIDTDELTKDDWRSIMLDLSHGDMDDSGAKTFNFIKENNEEGDTNMMWMVYTGVVLILASIVMILFVIVSASKEKYSY